MMKIFIPLLISIVFPLFCQASEMMYRPINPSFGGNALNSGHLLGVANAQNDYKDPDRESSIYERPASLDRFTSSLESRLLSQLMSDIGNGQEGFMTTDDFSINIIDDGGVLTVFVEDLVTGEITEIQVNGLDPNN